MFCRPKSCSLAKETRRKVLWRNDPVALSALWWAS